MNIHLPAGFKVPFMLLTLLLAQEVSAQQDCRVRYLYDDAGNRTKRYWLCDTGEGNPEMPPQGDAKLLDLASLKILPNPASDQAELRLVNDIGAAQVEVLDMQGKSVLTTAMTGDRTTLVINGLTNGLYSVRVTKGTQLLICPLSVQR